MMSDSPHVALMLDCIAKIRRFVSHVSYEQFKKNEEKQSAILMQLLLIGELSKRISTETKEKVDIPWPQIVGMRNRVVHEYHDIDLETIWKIITEDLATTEAPLTAYINQHPLPSYSDKKE